MQQKPLIDCIDTIHFQTFHNSLETLYYFFLFSLILTPLKHFFVLFLLANYQARSTYSRRRGVVEMIAAKNKFNSIRYVHNLP